MGEISDTFNKELDSCMLDSFNTIGRFQALLAILDPQLFLNLRSKNLDPRFYALRWLSLLFSQEYPVPDVQRLWDSLFSDENRFTFLLFFACYLVISVRRELINNEFSKDLMVLQSLPVPVMEEAIWGAEQLMNHTEPFKLEPGYMKQFLDELTKGHMTGSDMLALDDEKLQLEIKKQREKELALRSKKAETAKNESSTVNISCTPATESTTSETPESSSTSTSSETNPNRERKASIPGIIPPQFYTMPWHE